jgi:hypothetical protein
MFIGTSGTFGPAPSYNHQGGDMKRVSVILVAGASMLVLSAASWRIDAASPRALHLRAEVARLRVHFDSVDTELRMRDVSHLSAAQRASRTKLIAWLREYRNAGRFPLNDRFQNRRIPFFRDSRGTLCAMAYLVDRSGRGDIVDHIAKTRNNAYIGQLTDDKALVVWLDASGLSVSEAARIQPAYDGNPCCIVAERDRVSTNYAMLSIGLGGSSLGTIGFNAFGPSRTSGGLGLVAGVATIIAGAANLDANPASRRVAIANTAVGTVAAAVGLRTLFAMRSARSQEPAETSRRTIVSNASIAPDVIVTPNATMLGLRVHARF